MSPRVFIFDIDGTIANENCLEENREQIEINKNNLSISSDFYRAQLTELKKQNKIDPIVQESIRDFTDRLKFINDAFEYYTRNPNDRIVGKIDEVLKLLRIIKERNDHVYIVTTRPLSNNDTNIDKLFSNGVNIKIIKLIKEILYNQFGVKNKKDLINLNYNPKTRWLYFLNFKDDIKICNEQLRFNLFKIYVKQINPKNKYIKNFLDQLETVKEFQEDKYGGFGTGVIKMLQILDIKNLHPKYSWENMSFFDDATHNFTAYEEFCQVIPEMKEMKFYRGVVDHECVFWNDEVLEDLNNSYFKNKQKSQTKSTYERFYNDNGSSDDYEGPSDETLSVLSGYIGKYKDNPGKFQQDYLGSDESSEKSIAERFYG